MTNTPYKEQIEKIIRTSPSWNDKDPRTQSERIMEILDLAVAEREKEIVKIIIKSRTVNEQFGVGLNEETARNQILSDIMTTKELKQQAREEFDKQILNINIGTDWGICPSQIEAILHFLDSIIDRAVEMTEERISEESYE